MTCQNSEASPLNSRNQLEHVEHDVNQPLSCDGDPMNNPPVEQDLTYPAAPFQPTCPRCGKARLRLINGGAECADHQNPDLPSDNPVCDGDWEDAMDACREYATRHSLPREPCPVGDNPNGCRQGENDINSVINTGPDAGRGCFSCGAVLDDQ